MKGVCVLLDWLEGRPAAALMVDGRLEDVLIAPPEGAAPGVGAVFLARADRPMRGQGGITFDLGSGLKGYMRRAGDIAPGEMRLVQVSSVVEPGKACPVTPDVVVKGRYGIVTPFAPGINLSRAIADEEERDRLSEIANGAMEGATHGLILRSGAEGVAEDDIWQDLDRLRRLADDLMASASGAAPEWLMAAPDPHDHAWLEWTEAAPSDVVAEAGCFEHQGVLDAVDDLLAPQVRLSGGGTAYIEATRALVAVDVNTAADTSFAAGLKANLALARDLPRQLRIRGLGGQIVLDLAPMAKKERRRLEDALKKAFRQDGSDITVAGWTPLGHLELTRKRDRPPLATNWPKSA